MLGRGAGSGPAMGQVSDSNLRRSPVPTKALHPTPILSQMHTLTQWCGGRDWGSAFVTSTQVAWTLRSTELALWVGGGLRPLPHPSASSSPLRFVHLRNVSGRPCPVVRDVVESSQRGDPLLTLLVGSRDPGPWKPIVSLL